MAMIRRLDWACRPESANTTPAWSVRRGGAELAPEPMTLAERVKRRGVSSSFRLDVHGAVGADVRVDWRVAVDEAPAAVRRFESFA